MISNICIAAKQNQVGLRSAKRLEKELKNKGITAQFDRSTAIRLRKGKGISLKKFDGDLIITVGGDGTFLWTAYQAQKPILPVRLEGYGFLCTIDFKDLIKNIDKIISKKYFLFDRMRLQCTKVRKGIIERILHTTYPLSVNEIAFARKRPSKVLQIEFTVDGTSFEFVGDGLLISTPAGSTAYAASAGGSLIDHSLETISIVPLYPFNSKIKPLIVPANKKIEVRIKGGECALIIDGHTGEYVKANSEFLIEKSHPIKVVTLSDYKFYDRYKKVFLD